MCRSLRLGSVDVTETQMNGGGSATASTTTSTSGCSRSASSSSAPRCATRTPTRSARSCCCCRAEDPEADIFLHINSPGGSVDAGMAIYDTMNYIPNDVATVGMGLAASMGQFLLCAGAKGKRYALPHARIMMHQPSGGMGGSASDIKIQAAAVAAHQEGALRADQPSTPASRSSRSSADADRDRWFTAEQAQGVRLHRPRDHQRPRGRRRGPPGPHQVTEGRDPMNYYIPQWEERTSYGFRRIDPYGKLFEDRIIFLGTPISDDIANAVMAQLLCLESMDPDRDIQIYINSPGGSFTALTAIYDTMQFIKPDIQTVCLGQAASRGRDPARRRHPRQAAGAAQQPDPDPPALHRGHLRPDLRHRDPGQRDPADARAAREDDRRRTRGKDVEEVSRDIERDKILTAEQAVEYGLIDAILESRKGTPGLA